ncbi:MAG: integrase core domain-containing protein [Thermodesulfobacteriota bacterium]
MADIACNCLQREFAFVSVVLDARSCKGNPCDYVYAESFFKTLKQEEINAVEYKTMGDASERLPHFLEEVYSRRRLYSAIRYVPPEEHERKYARMGSQSPVVGLFSLGL